jgi:hypothetical protein
VGGQMDADLMVSIFSRQRHLVSELGELEF